MKRSFSIIVMLVVLFALSFPALGEGSSEALYLPKDEVLVDGQVVFNDAAVQQAIESNFAYGYLGADGLKEIEWLEIADHNTPPEDLSVLQLCTGLQILTIDASKVKSLEPLTLLNKLAAIEIQNAQAIDLEPLTRMKKLTHLQFTQCGALDFTPISLCSSLEELQFQNTNVEALPDMSGMKKLKKFIAVFPEGCTPSLAPVVECKKLESLYIQNNQQSLETISGLTKLKELRINGGTMEGFAELAAANAKSLNSLALNDVGTLDESLSADIALLTKLATLALDSMNGVSLSGSEGLKSLEEIIITNSENVDLTALGQLPKLSALSMERVRNVQFDSAAELPKLKELLLVLVDTDDLSFIARAPKLQELTIMGCRPTSFAFLNELACAKTLESLSLVGVDVADISFVSNLTKLEAFGLLDTQVTSIQPLESAGKLSSATLYGNPIEDYSVLKGLKKLKTLLVSTALNSDIVQDVQSANNKLSVQYTNGENIVDMPYMAATFYGDENPVARENRPQPEEGASEKALQAIRAEKQRERAAELEKLIEETKPVDESLLEYRGGGGSVRIDVVNSTAEVIRIPDTVNGEPVKDVWGLGTVESGTLKTLILPATMKEMNLWALNYTISALESVIVDPENPYYCSVDGVVFSKDMKTLIYCPSGLGQDYVIPDGVEKVKVGAFAYFPYSVSIPASVTEFEVFDQKYMLSTYVESVTVDDANPVYASLDGMLVDKAHQTLYIYPEACHQYESDNVSGRIVIPQGITTVMKNALFTPPPRDYVEIVIPASVTLIEDVDNLCRKLADWPFEFTFEVDPANPVYTSIDGALYTKDEQTKLFPPN